MPRLTGPVDRAYPRARLLQSIDRGRSIAPTCAHPCTPVDQPPPPVDRDIDREHKSSAPCAVPRSFVVRSLCYLLPSPPSPLSPLFQQFSTSVKIFSKSEPISNVPQSITWRNRHTISACAHRTKSTHDLDEIDTRSRLEICSSVIH